MLYLTCTTITSVDLAHYGVSRAKDWVSAYCGTKLRFQFSCEINDICYMRIMRVSFCFICFSIITSPSRVETSKWNSHCICTVDGFISTWTYLLSMPRGLAGRPTKLDTTYLVMQINNEWLYCGILALIFTMFNF